jgi:hypothetical protein
MNLQTAEQVNIRTQLSERLRPAFDVEFQRRRISTPIFVLLWGFFGFFGAHILYYWMKDPDSNWNGAGIIIPGFLLCWGNMMSSNASKAETAYFVTLVAVTLSGLIMIFGGFLRSKNDRIASHIAGELK